MSFIVFILRDITKKRVLFWQNNYKDSKRILAETELEDSLDYKKENIPNSTIYILLSVSSERRSND